MPDISRFRGRLLIFAMLFAIPFIRIVLRENYGLLHPEVALALLAAIGVAAIFAVATRWPLIMHVATVLVITVLSASTLQENLFPRFRLPYLMPALVAALALAIVVFRRNFYQLLLVFLAGAFLVDAGKSIAALLPSSRDSMVVSASGQRHHVIHIIFDEMIGLAGMPPDCAACQTARAKLEETFRQGNFRVYPYAFSNYDWTLYSVPSILNNRLVKGVDDYPHEAHPVLRDNAYFSRFIERGYPIRVYSSDFMSYRARGTSDFIAVTYKSSDLTKLRELTPTLGGRVIRLFTFFIRGDRFMSAAWYRWMPKQLELEYSWTAPLGVTPVWSRLLDDIRSANHDSLFFAHLLIPHFPYVYSSDGAVLSPREWLHEAKQSYYPGEQEAFHKRYELYGVQVQVAQRELSRFLQGLRAFGLHDSSTIIVHGDHGSRLRMKLQGPAGAAPSGVTYGVYDYKSAPDERDLLNRFSTLLAIKPAGAVEPQIVDEKGSVLHFLRKQFSLPAQPGEPDINSVYLFDDSGSPRRVRIMNVWNSGYPRIASGG